MIDNKINSRRRGLTPFQWLFALYAIGVIVFTGTQYAKMKSNPPAHFFKRRFSEAPSKTALGPIRGVRAPQVLVKSTAIVKLSRKEVVGIIEGATKWKFTFSPEEKMYPASLFVGEAIVLIGSSKGVVIALARDSGEFLWTYNLMLRQGRTTFAVAEKNEASLLIAAEDWSVEKAFLVKVDALTGESKWFSKALPIQPLAIRAVGSCGSHAYLQLTDQSVTIFENEEPSNSVVRGDSIRKIECDGDKIVVRKAET